MNFISRAKRSIPEYEFSFFGFKRGTIGVLSAPGSTGKGFLVLETLISMASHNMADHVFIKSFNKKVGYISLEDGDDVIDNRIQALCSSFNLNNDAKNLNRIDENFEIQTGYGDDYIVYNPKATVNDPKIQENRKRLAHFCTGKELVVIDTLSMFNVGDENSNADMAQLIVQLKHIAEDKNCSILIVHHSSKAATMNGQSDNQASTRGASSLIDNARYQITMQTMTQKEAAALQIHDYKMYVQVNFPKVNYVSPLSTLWYKRERNGTLTYLEHGFGKIKESHAEY